jgi:hypothetical protein
LLAEFSPEMEQVADTIIPFSADQAYDLVTILDDEDMKNIGKFDEETLFERYIKEHPKKERISVRGE